MCKRFSWLQNGNGRFTEKLNLLPLLGFFPFPSGFAAQRGPVSPLSYSFYITHTHTHTHNDIPQSAGLLWTGDQPFARDLYLTTRHTHTRQISMPPSGTRTDNPSREAAAQALLRPCRNWDWRFEFHYENCTRYCYVSNLLNAAT